MTFVFGLTMRLTASFAASSGRQRITASAPFSISARAAASLRRAGSIETSSMSPRFSRRWRICRPVVPASPSMKTVGFMTRLRSRACTLPLAGQGAAVLGFDDELVRSGRLDRAVAHLHVVGDLLLDVLGAAHGGNIDRLAIDAQPVDLAASRLHRQRLAGEGVVEGDVDIDAHRHQAFAELALHAHLRLAV